MILEFILLVIGLILLFYGSEWLVWSSSIIATSFSIKPIIIGLTIVAFGTSAPEFLVSLFASHSGESGISIGNILGSNVINIALVLGASIIVRPIVISQKDTNREMVFVTIVSLIFWGMCADGVISFYDGLILVLMLFSFLVYSFFTAKNNNQVDCFENPAGNSMLKHYAFIVIGIAFLCIGAHLVVNNAVNIAEYFNVSKTFIGLSIVALGTSLPELATSIVAARNEESEIAVGNVVGSNLFNICMVMGFVGILNPIKVDVGLNQFEFPFMILITLSLLVFLRRSNILSRKHGIFLVLCFILYIAGSFYLSKP